MTVLLEKMADAMEAAGCPDREGPYGLYNYSRYDNSAEPYQVRDFRDIHSPRWGATVFRSADRDTAKDMFDKLTRHHIAHAVLEVVLEHLNTVGGQTDDATR